MTGRPHLLAGETLLVLLGLSACRATVPAPVASPTPAASPGPGGEAYFEDRSVGSGLEFRNLCGGPDKKYILEVNGAGACALDYDRDGRLDLYLVNGSTIERVLAGQPGEPNRLFRGLGEGRFEDVTETAGVGDRGWGFGCSSADFDADGWPDLYVTNFGPARLYRNRGDGRFEDLTLAAGVDNPPAPGARAPSWGTGAAFADYDSDGILDLYVANYLDFLVEDPPVDGKVVDGVPLSCKWEGHTVMCGPRGLPAQQHRLYRGRGDGTFEDVSKAAGIAAGRGAYGFAVLPADLDDDGDLDFYVANDSVENYLWQNDGSGRFQDVALRAGAALNESGQAQASMGVDAQDVEGDGRLDLFFTNFAKDYNTLLRNLGGGQFMDVSFVAGVAAPSIERLAWGTSFLDVDHDADLDLFVVNGHVYPGAARGGEGGFRQRNQLFLNDGGKFADVSDRAGAAFAARRVGRGAAFGDFDGDGGIDVLVTNLDEPPTLLLNRAERGRSIELDLVGTRSNRDALGARLRGRTAQGRSVGFDLHTGSSYLSGNSLRVHLGLGSSDRLVELTVRWPAGGESRYTDLPAGGSFELHETEGLRARRAEERR